ncbi:MAG: hydroxyectoine utilization dehydratase EutB [Chloroflexota bacterium]
MSLPTLRDIFLAQQKIYPLARRTPLIYSPALSNLADTAVTLKLETVQEIGAFKIRGAANKILNLTPAQKERGVVTVSTGNHGRAVAYVAQQVGIRAVVCISEQVPANKVAAIEQLGAEVVITGQSQDDAGEKADQLVAEQGLTMIHPFDDPYIIAGQGTIGLELLQERPSLSSVLVPLSGGGLIAGIGLALKTAAPDLRVIGVSMERGPVMYHSLQAGYPVQLEELPTLADSLQGGIGLDNHYTYQMVQQFVDDIILVSEEEIAAAMAFAFRRHHLVLEGGAAVGIAALMSGKASQLGEETAVVLSGGNVDLDKLIHIVEKS